MLILGIETSCDETAAAVLEADGKSVKILSNVVASQIKIHRKYGGVVPEIAARKHAEVIFDVIEEALDDANAAHGLPLLQRGNKGDLQNQSKKYPLTPLYKRGEKKLASIDLVAVTYGPGLVTSLRVGVLAAQTLAALAKKPLIGVNHIEAHLLSPYLTNQKIKFPALGLVVSGGHTELILIKKIGDYKIIGSTRDDAVGEAFDKAAKILGLGYPGGPAIATTAQICNLQSAICNIKLPRPMLNSNDYDFSFAGLKTALLYVVKKIPPAKLKKMTPALAAEFQQAAVDVLVAKTLRAAKNYKIKSVLLGGGVSANRELREQLGAAIAKELPATKFLIPQMEYTGDNAAMIAFAGWQNYKRKKKNEVLNITAEPNLSIFPVSS
jgi:N6-L-threonylcarbamoyladenine synthase